MPNRSRANVVSSFTIIKGALIDETYAQFRDWDFELSPEENLRRMRDEDPVGHGSANALLVRRYELVGPMGDTWIDNLFAGFRVAPSPRMKRLLADRPAFWIGGAYCGAELAWESIAYFGWQPTARRTASGTTGEREPSARGTPWRTYTWPTPTNNCGRSTTCRCTRTTG